MTTKTILPKDPNDGTFLWLLWDKPPADHPINRSGNVNVIARTRSGWAIDSDIPDASYGRYGEFSATNPDGWDREFYTEANAQKVGKRLADWFEYQSLFKGNGTGPNKEYAGAVFVHDWGSPSTGPGLFREDADMVKDCVKAEDLANFANKSDILAARANLKYPVGFSKNAVQKSMESHVVNGKTILGISLWIQTAMTCMRKECDARNLCYPLYLAQDTENFEPYLFKLVGYNYLPSPTSTAAQFPREWASSVWKSAQADPRYHTETVYEEWNGTQWEPRTLADAYKEAGLPEHAPNEFFISSKNNAFTRRMAPYIAKIVDYGLSKMLYDPIKSVFPHIKCGNYNSVFPMASEPRNAYFANMDSWFYWPTKHFTDKNPAGKKHFHADFSSPVCYSPVLRIGNYSNYRYDPSQFNPSYDVYFANNPNTVTGHRFGPNSESIYRNFIKQRVRSLCINGNPVECVPWIECPGAGISDPSQTIHISTTEDLFDIVKDNYAMGVRTWQLFNPGYTGTLLTNSFQLHNLLHDWIMAKKASAIAPTKPNSTGTPIL